MSTLTKAIKRLGFRQGLASYWNFKTNSEVLKLEELADPVKLRSNTSDALIFKQIFYKGEYDIPFKFQTSYIIDGGGNIGLFAVLFANRYPEATIVSVEPDENNFLLLQANCKGYKNIHPVKSGIWNKEVSLKVMNQHQSEAGLIVNEVTKGTPGAIPAITIQQLMSKFNFPHIDILKLDVETAEEQIFASNYEEWLPKTKLLIIELHEFLRTGSSKSFREAINKYNFTETQIGENLCLYNHAFTASY